MAINNAIFFVIFDNDNALYILAEFESDWTSSRESAKNGRNGAHGLNCKIFVNSELIFEIYDENKTKKKLQNDSSHVFWLYLSQSKSPSKIDQNSFFLPRFGYK